MDNNPVGLCKKAALEGMKAGYEKSAIKHKYIADHLKGEGYL